MPAKQSALRDVALGALALIASMAAHAQQAAPFKDFEQFFQAAAIEDKIPGAAYAIVNHAGILQTGHYGYALAGQRQPVDENTVFRVASVSKTFASTLAALLVAEGTLSWSEPVTRYAPGFRINGQTQNIHLEHVLGQSTGLPAYAYDNFIEEGFDLPDILKKFSDLKPICRPGQCYTYQNSAFSLIQPALENATQNRYDELMESRIFQPLMMEHASVGYDNFLAEDQHAQPHVRRRGRWTGVEVQPNYYRVAPAAGINASVEDLAKWLMAHLGARPDVLPQTVLDDVTRPRVRTKRDLKRKHWRDHISDAHYALGWRVYQFGDAELIYHGGWVAGFRTDIAYSKEHDIGIAIVMNAEGGTVTELSTFFWDEFFKHKAQVATINLTQPAHNSSQSTQTKAAR